MIPVERRREELIDSRSIILIQGRWSRWIVGVVQFCLQSSKEGPRQSLRRLCVCVPTLNILLSESNKKNKKKNKTSKKCLQGDVKCWEAVWKTSKYRISQSLRVLSNVYSYYYFYLITLTRPKHRKTTDMSINLTQNLT